MQQSGVILPMDTCHPYTKIELLALRDKLNVALGERESVLGRAEINTVGSVSKGAEEPNDIDLRVTIGKSLLDLKVQEAAEEAIRVVILANCFDGQNARILRKFDIWQWPLDVGISDGKNCLWLQAMKYKTDEINFLRVDVSEGNRDFPEMSSSVAQPDSSPPVKT